MHVAWLAQPPPGLKKNVFFPTMISRCLFLFNLIFFYFFNKYHHDQLTICQKKDNWLLTLEINPKTMKPLHSKKGEISLRHWYHWMKIIVYWFTQVGRQTIYSHIMISLCFSRHPRQIYTFIFINVYVMIICLVIRNNIFHWMHNNG